MAFSLEHALCLDDKKVPLERMCLELDDPENLVGEDGSEAFYSVLDLRAKGNIRWLEMAFKVKDKFWRSRSRHIPLLQEIVKAIENAKPRKGASVRLPKRPEVIKPFEIRGKQLLMLNNVQKLSIALKPGNEVDELGWILGELKKDIDLMPGHLSWTKGTSKALGDEPQLSQEHNDGPGEEPEEAMDYEGHIEKKLEELKSSSNCVRASFLKSRSSLRVARKDGTSKEFGIQGFAKKRKLAMERQDELSFAEVREAIDRSADMALEFLEASGQPAASSAA